MVSKERSEPTTEEQDCDCGKCNPESYIEEPEERETAEDRLHWANFMTAVTSWLEKIELRDKRLMEDDQ